MNIALLRHPRLNHIIHFAYPGWGPFDGTIRESGGEFALYEWNRRDSDGNPEPMPDASAIQAVDDSQEFKDWYTAMIGPRNRTRRQAKERQRLKSPRANSEMARNMAMAKLIRPGSPPSRDELIEKIVDEIQ